MELTEIIALYEMNERKVNLQYTKPKGKIDYCFIDCTLPLVINKFVNEYRSKIIYFAGYDIRDVSMDFIENNKKILYVRVYKQQSKIPIWVKPENLKLQNEQKAKIIKVLYGK